MALAKWYKVDFHTHTPASKCFTDKTVDAKQWIKAAKEAGLNAVVVTDHNSVGFINSIEEIRKDYEEKEFKIFYGIELCVSSDFIHMLVIFNNELNITQIEDAVISNLGLKRDNWGNTEIHVDESRLKNLCNEMRNDIFIIPAHFASTKGLAGANINAIKQYQEFVKFDAIEVRNAADVKEYENLRKKGVINEAALITGSDNPSSKNEANHSLEGMGKSFTWLKMSKISFEGMRQAFIDPEHRCINWVKIQEIGVDFNPNEVGHNYISGIKIKGIKHLSDDIGIRFSPHLNCIVGGRGTGKSTIVDAISYGLNTSLDLNECEVLNKTFDKNGQIITYFEFGSNKSYLVETNRDGKKLTHNCKDDNGIVENPPEFKIDFYGQKEIFKLIEDDNNVADASSSPLVKMIDSKISSKLYDIYDEIENSQREMMLLTDEYKNKRRKIRELPNIKAEIAKCESIMKKFKASGIETARKEYDKTAVVVNDCRKEIYGYRTYFENLINELKTRIADIDKKIAFMQEKEEYSATEYIKRIKSSYTSLLEICIQQKDIASKTEEEFLDSEICVDLKIKKDAYDSALEKVKNTGSENIQEIQDKLHEYKQREKELVEIKNQQSDLEEEIKDKIDVYIKNRLNLTEQRKQMVKSLNLGNIKIEIFPLAHKNRWKQALQREIGKEGTFDSDFQKLVDNILTGEDLAQYKNFLYFLLTSENGNILEIANDNYDSRFCRLWEAKAKNDTLNSMAKVGPEDYISIKIIEESGEIDINEGSPGQKSAALLAFILSSGDNPLIIDQPEDDLDNSLIYSLIVKSIRKIKNHRQIIIVTHNPNIPVLGDAEGIIILERNSDGKVTFRNGKKAGCIEEQLIRDGICEIMEGGEGAFKKREQKYLYSK